MSKMGLGKLVLYTAGGLMFGDVFSYMLLHPGKKHDYGFLNKYLKNGREVRSKWWGTRLEHMLTISGYICAFDITSAKLWGRYFKKRGKTFSFKQTPLAYLFHCYVAIGGAVIAYIAHNAYFDPSLKDKREEFIKDGVYSTLTGVFSMMAHPFTMGAATALAAAFPPLSYLWIYCMTNVVHFYGVKAIGFKEFDLKTLTPYEKEMNNIKNIEA